MIRSKFVNIDYLIKTWVTVIHPSSVLMRFNEFAYTHRVFINTSLERIDAITTTLSEQVNKFGIIIITSRIETPTNYNQIHQDCLID